MTIIGEKLKAAREAKGYSIDYVSRETNIARRYIEALEEGNFSQFPAEAYLIGFLKNYGEYLALDGKELQAQYRMHKIQEQPIPVEQLLREPSRAPGITIALVASLFAGALIFGLVFYFVSKPRKTEINARAERRAVVHELSEGLLEQRLYLGDTVKVGGSDWSLILQKIGDIITFSTPSGELLLGLNDTAKADVNGDGQSELEILVQDFLPNKPENGVLVRLDAPKDAVGEQAAQPVSDVLPAETAALAAQSNTATNSQALFSGNTPYPFTLEIRFQSYCMFRWEILREANQGRNERYFVKGDVLNIQAQNGVRLWISNAASAKTQAIGGGRTVALDFGGPGEIVVADINWIRDTDGRYKLIQTRLEN
ncbi:MAG: helix-turn-helix domain-containing protein [Spirochaetaceae bacterium]|jgi:cytoskeletal protein RodZ|nr:helix-turn-helix domain-containing protein [Spirochaetaceae bacterium]